MTAFADDGGGEEVASERVAASFKKRRWVKNWVVS